MTDCQIENHPGHGQPCHYCKEPCDGFAGNPGRWPVALCYADDPGAVKWHHTGCVVAHIEKQAARIAKLEARLEIDHYYVSDPDAKRGLDPETGEFHLGLRRVEATEEEREDFPDKILCLECEVAHLEEDRDACARERDEAINALSSSQAEIERLREALEFYADPENYHAIAFLGDAPCGDFADDFDEDHGHPDYNRAMPGRRARSALSGQPGESA